MKLNPYRCPVWILAAVACALCACGGSSSSPGTPLLQSGLHAFATGSSILPLVLDADGYLREEQVLTTPEGIRLRLRGGTQVRARTGTGAPITGPVEFGVDGGVTLIRPDGGPALGGVVRATVRTPAGLVSASFEPEAKLELELHDGTLAGHWELLAYAQVGGYVTGTDPDALLSGSPLVEVHQGTLRINVNGPEKVDLEGTGPIGFLFVPHAEIPMSAKPVFAIAPPTGPIYDVNFDLTADSQDFDLLRAFSAYDNDSGHLLCQWIPRQDPHWQDGVAIDFTNALGESWAIIWQGSAADPAFREISVRSVFKNPLESNIVLAPSNGGANTHDVDPDGVGGIKEEVDLDGPYAGPVKIELIGSDITATPFTEVEYLETLLPAGVELVIESIKVWGTSVYRAKLLLQQYYPSVAKLAAELPDTWKVDIDGRSLRIAATDLFYDFETDADGWVFGHDTGPLDRAERNGRGKAYLDGSDLGDEDGEPAANAWMTRIIDLPANVTTLTVRVSSHDKAGTDAAFRVSLSDIAAGTTVVLHGWEVLETLGSNAFHFVDRNLNISAYAGKTVSILIEQDDDGDGAGEQIWIEEIVVY